MPRGKGHLGVMAMKERLCKKVTLEMIRREESCKGLRRKVPRKRKHLRQNKVCLAQGTKRRSGWPGQPREEERGRRGDQR